MTWDSQGDAFDAARSLSSGLFNAAGVQVKGILGSSFTTDVIKVERNGIESAVKILTPGATKDPDIVSRFLLNARYNKALGEFTSMPISEIVETGPRPYYVMDRVAESSLLEIIRLHAPIDPYWLASLLLPVARSLDTIHQRNVLHANIKPSNFLVALENGQEKIILVDFLEPSLAATSATITGAGIYAAPEFRIGTPVSNRSDIFSLASVVYEGLSGDVPHGTKRNPDGTFHVWRNFDRAQELNILNPEIPKSVSDVVMSGLSPQAISRPASASVMVEEILRHLEEPRTRVRVDQPQEQAPVPMLLIAVGVFILTMLLLFGGIKIFGSLFGNDDVDFPTPTSAATSPDTLSPAEEALNQLLPSASHSNCRAERISRDRWRFPTSSATIYCDTQAGVVSYSSFDSENEMDSAFEEYVKLLADQAGVESDFPSSPGRGMPCTQQPNERGRWQGTGSIVGKYACVSTPEPTMIWSEESNFVIGYIENDTSIDQLATWWFNGAGPA